MLSTQGPGRRPLRPPRGDSDAPSQLRRGRRGCAGRLRSAPGAVVLLWCLRQARGCCSGGVQRAPQLQPLPTSSERPAAASAHLSAQGRQPICNCD